MSCYTPYGSLGYSIKYLVFVLLLIGMNGKFIAASAFQEKSRLTPDFEFTCTQNNQEFVLGTRLSHWNGERDVPIIGAAIIYYQMDGEDSRQLEVIRTNMDGKAEYRIRKGSELLTGTQGQFTFRTLYKGSHLYEMSEGIKGVKPLDMQLEFIEIDSVKTIVARAAERDEEGTPIPLEDTDVYFYATRSFSLLPVGEEWFLGGMAAVDFPITLPGDSAGNITIIARIEDHEFYGNVEAAAVKDWGLARPPVVVERRRGLGDTDAPLWMVYTLIVLLSIVWFHYLYVFYTMIKIKKLRQEVNYDSSKE